MEGSEGYTRGTRNGRGGQTRQSLEKSQITYMVLTRTATSLVAVDLTNMALSQTLLINICILCFLEKGEGVGVFFRIHFWLKRLRSIP